MEYGIQISLNRTPPFLVLVVLKKWILGNCVNPIGFLSQSRCFFIPSENNSSIHFGAGLKQRRCGHLLSRGADSWPKPKFQHILLHFRLAVPSSPRNFSMKKHTRSWYQPPEKLMHVFSFGLLKGNFSSLSFKWQTTSWIYSCSVFTHLTIFRRKTYVPPPLSAMTIHVTSNIWIKQKCGAQIIKAFIEDTYTQLRNSVSQVKCWPFLCTIAFFWFPLFSSFFFLSTMISVFSRFFFTTSFENEAIQMAPNLL